METAFWQVAGEEWGENEKDCVEKVGKENGDFFSCSYDRVGRAERLLCIFEVTPIFMVDTNRFLHANDTTRGHITRKNKEASQH